MRHMLTYWAPQAVMAADAFRASDLSQCPKLGEGALSTGAVLRLRNCGLARTRFEQPISVATKQ